jgi:transposase-like protein
VPSSSTRFVPLFCPNPLCPFHTNSQGWRFRKIGFYLRQAFPHRIQRYLCSRCRRAFSSQTFSTSYWLRKPELPRLIFGRLVACSGYRQIARDLGISPTTVLRQAARLGRHCLLFHERLRPQAGPKEHLVVDGLESFEYSQYTPVHFNTAVGATSHYIYGFTDSELRRKGRMTARQRLRREELERRYGRPDPRSIEREMAALVALVAPIDTPLTIRCDEHKAYPRAFASLRGRPFTLLTTHSRVARTAYNPLFAINRVDLLIRHSSANHKRETIAFSKRRQSAIERLFVFLVWVDYGKSFSERKRDATPAQRLGLVKRKLTVEDVLQERLFPSRVALPERWVPYYWRLTPTRRIPNARKHTCKYAA